MTSVRRRSIYPRALLRVTGHKLVIRGSGERTKAERSATGECRCGWSESASTWEEVRNEYRFHLRKKRDEQLAMNQRLRRRT